MLIRLASRSCIEEGEVEAEQHNLTNSTATTAATTTTTTATTANTTTAKGNNNYYLDWLCLVGTNHTLDCYY